MTSFQLSDSPEAALLLKMGFENLTEIQKEAIPQLAEGNSLLALAPTGSGKTLAFLVPLMLKVRPDVFKTQLLIVAPTRELGLQIAQVAERVAQNMSGLVEGSLLVRTAFGGTKVENQKTELLKNPHVIVATPGRALDLAERELLHLSNVNAVVLDEADLMLGMGFAAEMTSLCSFLPRNVQAALFTATEATLPGDLETRLLNGAVRVDVRDAGSENETGIELAPAVHEFLLVANHSEKRPKLVQFLREISARVSSGIIFCQTREAVRTLSEFLRDQGFSAEELSGDLGQIQRSTILRRFKAGGLQFLVATNIAARGIDVKDLSVVVHFDLPSTTEEYVHRSGRSGRAGKQGWTVSMCPVASKEFLFDLVKDLEIAIKPVAPLGSLAALPASAAPSLKKQFRKLHFNRGKSHKIRPGDIVGTLTQGMGLSKEDVGSIFIFDHFTHVEVNEDLVKDVIRGLEKTKIKNMTVKATEALG